VLNCSDIFNTHTSVTNYNLSSYYESINRLKETRVVNLTFTYRFGKSDVGKGGGMGKGKGKDEKSDKKPVKPSDEDRENNLKEKDDNDQPGGGGREGQKKEGKGM
jgi:hypothetical protein